MSTSLRLHYALTLQQHGADKGEHGHKTGNSQDCAVHRGDATGASAFGVVTTRGTSSSSGRGASARASSLVLAVARVLRARAVQTRAVTSTVGKVLEYG